MFAGLARGAVSTNGFRLRHILKDIETLNRWALSGRLEITAMSLHAYALCAKRYAPLTIGASIGDGYGPLLVSKKKRTLQSLSGERIALPGKLTTASLVLHFFLPEFKPRWTRFDKISQAVLEGRAAAGLLIHEGQLTYRKQGLEPVADLGKLWKKKTNLPLPLGINAVRRDIPKSIRTAIREALLESIRWGFAHRQKALHHAMPYARGVSLAEADRFVKMYVNRRTLRLDEKSRRAARLLLDMAHRRGLLPKNVPMDWQ